MNEDEPLGYELDEYEQQLEDEADQWKPVDAETAKKISDMIDAVNAVKKTEQQTAAAPVPRFDFVPGLTSFSEVNL